MLPLISYRIFQPLWSGVPLWLGNIFSRIPTFVCFVNANGKIYSHVQYNTNLKLCGQFVGLHFSHEVKIQNVQVILSFDK